MVERKEGKKLNYVDYPNTIEQTVLSIGFGQLGIERGIESAGTRLRVAAYVEIEAFVIANIIGLMEKGMVASAPIWADLKTFDAGPFRGKLHGLIAGYPCQPFSVAGRRDGTNDPRHLWPYIEKTIKSAQPLWCFFENVEGHLTLGFDAVYKSLRSMGYAVEAGIFSASEVGAPHQRKRLFILAVSLGHTQYHGSLTRTNKGRDGQADERCKKGTYLAKQREGAGSMANGYKSGFRGKYKEGLQSETQRGGKEELGYSKSNQQWGSGNKSQHGEFKARRSGDCKLSNTISTNGNQVWEKQAPEGFGGFGTQWPAPPGPYQKEWEEPRTISRIDAAKPGMGCTIDGYNFREDLLRLFGNGVVHQTAGIAWKELWRKHLNYLK